MTESQTVLKAERRAAAGKSERRRLRRSGRVPAVVYGKHVSGGSIPVSVDKKELLERLQAHPHAILELDIPGEGRCSVLATELQQHPISRDLVHVDFHQVRPDEKIKAPVRLEASGKSAGEKEGGLLQFVLHELEVECLPKDLPDVIKVPMEHLEIGDVLTVGELPLPPGVVAAEDPDTVIVTVLAPQKEAVAEPAQPAEAPSAEQKA